MDNELFSTIAFYIVAHADDWQLFMQPNVYKDLISPSSKIVFIITTAGDAGGEETYWCAREEGCKSSIRFCLAPLTALSESAGNRELNNRAISYWSVNNATCYFLRLPDGNLRGEGFPTHNYHSLCAFRNGQIDAISAIDNSATYTSWSDFSNTLQTIIEVESKDISDRWINYLNPDLIQNPNDHADHIATGQAIQEMLIISNLQQALYVGYSSSNAQEKLNLIDLFWKAGMFAAYEKAVYDISGYSTLKESVDIYLNWCSVSSKFIIVNSSSNPNSKQIIDRSIKIL